jgi:pyridoxamine 5'-phosphate oxidase
MENLKENPLQLRKEYNQTPLLESEVSHSPFEQFELWFNQVLRSEVEEPYAMVLSTVNNSTPCSRIVLLREFSKEGFGFYTNYNSDKGQQILSNNHVALNFFWPGLERQIRIQGIAIKETEEKSDAYFKTRSEIGRVGEWSSIQSSELKDRNELEELFRLNEKYHSGNPDRPDYWGGYIVKPDYFEFWQGRPDHLNDRLVYTLKNNTLCWKIKRLAP